MCQRLTILHNYRNATYHRDKHNPVVLPVLARIALVATSDLLSRTAAGFGNRGVGGGDSVEWLQRYCLDDSPIWFETVARTIANELKRGIRPRLATVKKAFAADVQARLEAIRNMLGELFASASSEEIEKNFRAALARYSTLDELLTSFEQSTYRCYVEAEWAGEMLADIERGK